jgi:hypothetical protein
LKKKKKKKKRDGGGGWFDHPRPAKESGHPHFGQGGGSQPPLFFLSFQFFFIFNYSLKIFIFYFFYTVPRVNLSG